MSRFSFLSLCAGVVLSVLALYLAFYNVPFSDLFSYLATVSYGWALLAALLVMACFGLRAVRWQWILEEKGKLPFPSAYHPLMIGFMINCILPGRVGEAARPFLLQQRENIPFSFGLATVAAERFFDLILLFVLLALTLNHMNLSGGREILFGQYRLNQQTLEMLGTGMARLGVILAVGMGLLVAKPTREFFFTLALKAPDLIFFLPKSTREKFRGKICVPTVRLMENMARGFFLFAKPKRVLKVACITALIWGIQAVSYYLMSLGCPDMALSLGQTTAVMVIISFFIALPSVPGFWGLWEAGGVFALSMMAVPEDKAAGFALLSHVVQMFPVILAGWVSALATGMGMRKALKLGHKNGSSENTG